LKRKLLVRTAVMCHIRHVLPTIFRRILKYPPKVSIEIQLMVIYM
jgi:hypothetical protein